MASFEQHAGSPPRARTVSSPLTLSLPKTSTWKTFLRNHAEGIASIDLFVVPTITFEQLFAFLVLGHGRRLLLWIAVTRDPTANWLARQIPWERVPKYIIRDNDRAFGVAFKARMRAMGIRDRPTSFRSPWQNGYVERLIGSIRRECTDLAPYTRQIERLGHIIIAHPVLGGLRHRYARI